MVPIRIDLIIRQVAVLHAPDEPPLPRRHAYPPVRAAAIGPWPPSAPAERPTATVQNLAKNVAVPSLHPAQCAAGTWL